MSSPPTPEDVERVTRAFLRQVVPDPRIVDDLSAQDPIWGPVDSLQLLALVQHLEQTFEIRIKPTDLVPENFVTIEKVSQFIAAQGVPA